MAFQGGRMSQRRPHLSVISMHSLAGEMDSSAKDSEVGETSMSVVMRRKRQSERTSMSLPSGWMTEEMLTKPKRQFWEHVKHVLCKRSFVSSLAVAGISTLVASFQSDISSLQTDISRLQTQPPDDNLYSLFSTLVSFFVVIRTGHALSRLFEAATMTYGILGDWSDAVSSLLSFTRKATSDEQSVQGFQNLLVILVSMLNALCLADLEGKAADGAPDYTLINFAGFPQHILTEISSSDRRSETVFQMIQALIVDNMDSGILNVPSPILTRSFQEMSQAMLKVHEARKLVNVPYPVALNAASTFLLVVHTIITVWYVPHWLQHRQLCLAAIFIIAFIYWYVHFVCGELEKPFSSRCTAIDLCQAQDELNQRLQTFVHGARRAPLELRPHQATKTPSTPLRSLRTMEMFAAQDHAPDDPSESPSIFSDRLGASEASSIQAAPALVPLPRPEAKQELKLQRSVSFQTESPLAKLKLQTTGPMLPAPRGRSPFSSEDLLERQLSIPEECPHCSGRIKARPNDGASLTFEPLALASPAERPKRSL